MVERAIEGLSNIILTNVVNYQNDFSCITVLRGHMDLLALVTKYNPSKIICLGKYAKMFVKPMICDSKKIYIAHPSFVLRFNRNIEEYTNTLRQLCS